MNGSKPCVRLICMRLPNSCICHPQCCESMPGKVASKRPNRASAGSSLKSTLPTTLDSFTLSDGKRR